MTGSGDDGGEEERIDPRFDRRFQRGYAPESGEEEPALASPERDELDPRFDPRFQRGFDPERHRPERDDRDGQAPVFSSSLKSGARPAPPVAPSDQPVRRLGEPVAPLTQVRRSDVLASDGEETGRATDERGEPQPTARTGRVNPFVAAMWAVGVVLTVGGVYYILEAAENPTARFVASIAVGDVVSRYAWTVAPIALQVGISTMVALLAWHAVTRMRSRGRSER